MFERVERDGVAIHTVPSLFAESGIGVAFTERGGGASSAPFDTLNLASHVGDDPTCVDENRARLLDAIGIGVLRDRLTTAEQVHGTQVAEVTAGITGAGAFAGGPQAVPGTDALWTAERVTPLMLLFADCVPVVLARPSIPAVAVVHAGWRGLAAGIVGRTADLMGALPGSDDLIAFVGPHIGACCFEVGEECASQFEARFVVASNNRHVLDLGAAVAADLEGAGVGASRQWHLGICTAHHTDRFFSHRAEGITGRHAALAVIV